MPSRTHPRLRSLLRNAAKRRLLVFGDVMLDHFVWGRVSRISPEAPVPIVDFERESWMPGGAANVARNLSALGIQTRLFGAVGNDSPADRLTALLRESKVECSGLLALGTRPTSLKMRIVAGQQQITRLDRENRQPLDTHDADTLQRALARALPSADGVIVADYGKGCVTPAALESLKSLCRKTGKWLSFDAKPSPYLDLRGLSLIKPNRGEAFGLAGIADTVRDDHPLRDGPLMAAAQRILDTLTPALLLITLGEQGLLLCRRNMPPVHIPTVAREVFDVSGAGDTVIAAFTFAIVAGASPVEAAILANHAAGVVVGKRGTATVTPEELIASFEHND